jgi:hypothetical protein
VNIGNAFPQLLPQNSWLGETRSDILLAHEMNHAVQHTQGMGDVRLVRPTDNARDREDPAMALDAASRNGRNLPSIALSIRLWDSASTLTLT